MRPTSLLLALPLSGLLAAQQNGGESIQSRSAAARKAALERISALVTGRCVDAATGAPLAGCRVLAWAWGGPPDPSVPEVLRRPKAVTTGADGRFRIRLLAREKYNANLEITAPGRIPRLAAWTRLLPDEVEDLGKVPVPTGVCAAGRVVNEKGEPIADVSIRFRELQLAFAAKGERTRKTSGVRYTRSDAQGRFRSVDGLPPGTHPIRIHAKGVTLVTKSITVPTAGPMQPATIVVKELPYLGGIVVDEKGKPVAGVRLSGSGAGRMAESGKDGRFKLYRAGKSPDRLRLQIWDPGPCEPKSLKGKYGWGQRDIKLVLRRALTIPVQVVEAATGKPVEGFAVRAHRRSHAISSVEHELRHSGRHAQGIARIDRIPRGRAIIQIVPKNRQLLPARIELEAKPEMKPVRIELQRLVPMKILVVDPKGKPVAGVQVRVIEPGNYPNIRGERPLNDPRVQLRAYSSNPDLRFDEQIFIARTDGGGQCIVYGIDGRDDLVLYVGPTPQERDRIEGVAFGRKHLSRRLVYDEK